MHADYKISRIERTSLLSVGKIPNVSKLVIRQIGFDKDVPCFVAIEQAVNRTRSEEEPHESALVLRGNRSQSHGVVGWRSG